MANQASDLQSVFNAYCEWQAQNNRGTQIGIYSIAVIGLSIAIRRVRPFTKFTKPHDVPNSFIKTRREIVGTVNRIEPNGAVLMINHMPLIRLPGLNTSTNPLPVKIANVNISGLGINWLQTIVAGNQVTFVPLAKAPAHVFCEVNLSQLLKNKKQQTIDVGESLISVGFAKFEQHPDKVKDIMHKIYIDRLKYAEELHMKREMGFKYYIKQTKMLLLLTIRFLYNYSVLPLYNIAMHIARSQGAAKKIDKSLPVKR